MGDTLKNDGHFPKNDGLFPKNDGHFPKNIGDFSRNVRKKISRARGFSRGKEIKKQSSENKIH